MCLSRWGPVREQHSVRLCVLLSLPAMCSDCTEHPERWEKSPRENVTDGATNSLTGTFIILYFYLRDIKLIMLNVCAWAGMQQEGKLKVRVEPGLFEWTKWVSGSSLPAWIPPTDLAAAHFSVDTTYRWCKQVNQFYLMWAISNVNVFVICKMCPLRL